MFSLLTIMKSRWIQINSFYCCFMFLLSSVFWLFSMFLNRLCGKLSLPQVGDYVCACMCVSVIPRELKKIRVVGQPLLECVFVVCD